MRNMKKLRILSVILALVTSVVLISVPAGADSGAVKKLTLSKSVIAMGEYSNWDGVSNVSQFLSASGEPYCAYDSGDGYVTVIRTKDGLELKKKIKLKKTHPLFGTVISDKDGNYYLVTGEENKGSVTSKETVFISKYSSSGKLLATVGDNGSSSLDYYYDGSFYTKLPFDGGNCDAAIYGDVLAVNYAREMYGGHQSNSLFAVNINTMEKVSLGVWYNSHSFAQRAMTTKNGFLFVSEGDAYNRAFTVYSANMSGNKLSSSNEGDVFHFWVEKSAGDKGNMFVLNDNFAHLGGIVSLPDGKAALAATSAKSLNKKAADESEELFIQIFDPSKNLSSSSAYVTSGTRSGLSGINGDQNVTDYGVKWLTAFGDKAAVSSPQVVATDDGKIVVLYERRTKKTVKMNSGSAYNTTEYSGVYYIVLDKNGKVLQKAKRFSKTAMLNPCEMPVCSGNSIYWFANDNNDSSRSVYLNTLTIK